MGEPGLIERGLVAAVAALKAGDADRADAALRPLLAVDEKHPAVHQLLGAVALEKGRPKDALHHAKLSLSTRPDHGASLLIAGRAANLANDPGTAITYLRRLVAADPQVAQAQFECGKALFALGEFAAACDAFAVAAQLEPAAKPIQFNRGQALLRAGRHAEARDAFARVTALDPRDADAWFSLGLVCQDLRDLESAAVAFTNAVSHRPDYAEAAVNLGIVLQDMGRMGDAMEAYRRAVRLRADTFGRIAQALTTASTGRLVLDLGTLRRALAA